LETKFYEKLVGGHLQLPPPREQKNGTMDLPMFLWEMKPSLGAKTS
jgi:hypothetical protein